MFEIKCDTYTVHLLKAEYSKCPTSLHTSWIASLILALS
jgi:hypothetical protein